MHRDIDMLAEMAERRLTYLILVYANVQLVSGLCYVRRDTTQFHILWEFLSRRE
jgi:hypothetical protein